MFMLSTCSFYNLIPPEQYSLSPLSSALTSAATRAAMLGAMKNGSPWVLKPQREGGGNNLYGTELEEFLHKHQEDSVLSGESKCVCMYVCEYVCTCVVVRTW